MFVGRYRPTLADGPDMSVGKSVRVYRWEVSTVHTVCTLQPGEAGQPASQD
jgi:hypothetical protein